MKKLSTLVHCLLIVSAAVAAPTANEDFVIAEDAQTFTNAVNAAKAYTDLVVSNLPPSGVDAATVTNIVNAVAADYLPLTGGTLDGMLYAKGIVAGQRDSSGFPHVFIGMNTNCFVSLITDEAGNAWRGFFYLPIARLAGMNINDTEALANLADIAVATNAAVRAANNYTDEVANDIAAAVAAIPDWAKAATKPTYTASEVGATTPADVTAAIREQSLGGIWDEALQVWWTPRMRNGSLTYEATTNVNLNAEN